MGIKKKLHRKKVAARNKRIAESQNRTRKLLKQRVEAEIEQRKLQDQNEAEQVPQDSGVEENN